MGKLVAGLLLVLLLLPLAVGVPAAAAESPFMWNPLWGDGYPAIGGPGVKLKTYADRFAEDLRKAAEKLEELRFLFWLMWEYTFKRDLERLWEAIVGFLREVLELVRRVAPWVG